MDNQKPNWKAALLIILMSSFFYKSLAQSDSLSQESNTFSKEIILYKPLQKMGSLFNTRSEAEFINKTEFEEINYISPLEIIDYQTSVAPLFTNSFGKRDRFSNMGYIHNSSLFNGVSQFGIDFSTHNIWETQTDNVENIEIYEGAEAISLSPNSKGFVINYQKRIFDTKKPFVRLWASDMNNDLLSFEGTIAQNFAPNWNYNFNYKTLSGEGKYRNDDFRSRNFRFEIRRTFDSLSQLNVSYLHNNTIVGSNAGINPRLSLDLDGNFTDAPLSSRVHFSSLNRRNKNHQVNANYLLYLDTNYKSSLNINAFSNYEIQHNNLGDLNFQNDTILKPQFLTFGANSSLELNFKQIFLKTGANISSISSEDFNYLNFNISGFSKINLGQFQPYGSLNISRFLERNTLDFGAGIDLNVFGLPLKIDYSNFNIVPNTNQLEAKIENHNLIFAKTEITLFNSRIELSTWHRSISNQIIYGLVLTDDEIVDFNYLENRNLALAGFSSRLKFKAFDELLFKGDDFNLDFKLVTNPFVFEGISSVPDFYSEIIALYHIPSGKSEANFGASIRLANSFQGYGFINYFDSFYVNPYQEIPNMFSNIELFGRIRLNHAWVKISFVNPLSSDIYYLAFHRGINTFFRLSFNWSIK